MYCHIMISLAEWRFWAFGVLRAVYGRIKVVLTETQSNTTAFNNTSEYKGSTYHKPLSKDPRCQSIDNRCQSIDNKK